MSPISNSSASGEASEIQYSNSFGVNLFPKHVGIIPDGNRRWARQNNYPVLKAHELAVDRLIPQIEHILKSTNVETLTIWGLSSENLSRPPGEVNAIYDVIFKFLPKLLPICHKYQTKVNRIGSITGLPIEVIEILDQASCETSCYKLRQCNIAINYGGRKDIADAVNTFIATNPAGTPVTIKDIDKLIAMGQDKFPEPELIIRSGADSTCLRSSGFLTWQGMNAHYYFLQDLLPDLQEESYSKAFIEYENMVRVVSEIKKEEEKSTQYTIAV